MTADQIFSAANSVAVLCWILLAILPDRRWVTRSVTGTALPGLFALAYVAIVIAVLPLFLHDRGHDLAFLCVHGHQRSSYLRRQAQHVGDLGGVPVAALVLRGRNSRSCHRIFLSRAFTRV